MYCYVLNCNLGIWLKDPNGPGLGSRDCVPKCPFLVFSLCGLQRSIGGWVGCQKTSCGSSYRSE